MALLGLFAVLRAMRDAGAIQPNTRSTAPVLNVSPHVIPPDQSRAQVVGSWVFVTENWEG